MSEFAEIPPSLRRVSTVEATQRETGEVLTASHQYYDDRAALRGVWGRLAGVDCGDCRRSISYCSDEERVHAMNDSAAVANQGALLKLIAALLWAFLNGQHQAANPSGCDNVVVSD
jgi:hypothetical protein